MGTTSSYLRNHRWGAVAVVAAPFLLWAVYRGLTWDLRGEAEASVGGLQPVKVERRDLAEQVIATGVTKPLRFVVIQSEIPGVVARVLKDDGDRVQQGDVLVELDRERMEHRVEELRAALAMDTARAGFDVKGKAESEYRRAKQDFERVQGLSERNVASAERLDVARTAFELARIALADAEAETTVRKAAVEKATARLRLAEKDLEKAVIRSPIDGVVVNRKVEVGNAVTDLEHGGTVIALLADDRSIHVHAQVDENDIAGVRTGQEAEVRIDAFPDETFVGHVSKVSLSGAGDGKLASFEVEIELDPDPRFRIGMSSDVRITLREHKAALLVPNNSILRTSDGPAIRLAQGSGGAYEIVPIRELFSNGFYTAIDETGISEGDRVLVSSRTP
jgi:HlyD family secretion protein